MRPNLQSPMMSFVFPTLAVSPYNLGTTGNPKGVILTHQNMISVVNSASRVAPLESTDVHISYLPLAHIFERMVMMSILGAGGSAGFYRGDGASI